MVIHKTSFFFLLAFLILIPFAVVRLVWLAGTQRTMGLYAFPGKGDAGEQLPLEYSNIVFRAGKDTVWFKGLGNLPIRAGDSIPVRYRKTDPADARVDSFLGIWGDVLVYAGIPVFLLFILYLHPEVVPRRSRLRLAVKRPYIRII